MTESTLINLNQESQNIKCMGEMIHLFQQQLENSYQSFSQDSETISKVKNIQVTVDKIQEFYNQRNFAKVKNAISCVFEDIAEIQKSGNITLIPSSILDKIDIFIESLRQSFDDLRYSLDIISGAKYLPPKDDETLILDFDKITESEEFVLNLELFSEKIEENIEVLNFSAFEFLEGFFEELLDFGKQPFNENIKKGEYRRRIRYTSVFFLTLIDNLREDVDAEDKEVINDFMLLIPND
jgi:hypothetical protein